MPDSKDLGWIPYKEYKAQEKFYREREQELLKKMGLGWLIDFCEVRKKTEEIEKDNDLKKENEY